MTPPDLHLLTEAEIDAAPARDARAAETEKAEPFAGAIDPCAWAGTSPAEAVDIWTGRIPKRVATQLAGDGGGGKSLLAHQLVTCTATAQPFLGWAMERRKAIFISCEDEKDEMHRRQERMNAALGGSADLLEKPSKHLKAAPIIRAVHAAGSGAVAAIATRELGLAVIELGGGRLNASDTIDHAVGLAGLLGKGASAGKDAPLCMVHARDEASFARASEIVKRAYTMGDAPAVSPPVIQRITP